MGAAPARPEFKIIVPTRAEFKQDVAAGVVKKYGKEGPSSFRDRWITSGKKGLSSPRMRHIVQRTNEGKITPQKGIEAIAGRPLAAGAENKGFINADGSKQQRSTQSTPEKASSRPSTEHLSVDELAHRQQEQLKAARAEEVNEVPTGIPIARGSIVDASGGNIESPNPSDESSSAADQPTSKQRSVDQSTGPAGPAQQSPDNTQPQPPTDSDGYKRASPENGSSVDTQTSQDPDKKVDSEKNPVLDEEATPPIPNTVPNADTTPAVAPADLQASSEVVSNIDQVRKNLSEGFMIGGVVFKADENTDATKAFANGIQSILRRNEDGSLDVMDQAYIRYAVQTAQVAGISTDELRVALTDLFPRTAVMSPDGKTIVTPENKGASQGVRSLLTELGLPSQEPTDPQSITESARERAQQERMESLGRIIIDNRSGAKLPVEQILPTEDVRLAAAEIIEEKGRNSGWNKRETDVVDRILTHGSAEDFASIIAYPGRFASQEGAFNIADLIQRRIQNEGDIRRRFGRWRGLSDDLQQSILAQEQFAALMATKEELKKIKRRYKDSKNPITIAMQLLLYLFGSTGYQLVASELGQVVEEGRVPGA